MQCLFRNTALFMFKSTKKYNKMNSSANKSRFMILN